MREPIKPSDLRIGDKVRTEGRDGRPFGTHPQMLASEWIISEDDLDGDFEGVDMYLLERRAADDVDLPTEPTLGWVQVKHTHTLKDDGGSVLGFVHDRTAAIEVSPHGFWDRHWVTAFTPAVAVPKDALETLEADLSDSYPDMAGSVGRFLADIDAANGDPR